MGIRGIFEDEKQHDTLFREMPAGWYAMEIRSVEDKSPTHPLWELTLSHTDSEDPFMAKVPVWLWRKGQEGRVFSGRVRALYKALGYEHHGEMEIDPSHVQGAEVAVYLHPYFDDYRQKHEMDLPKGKDGPYMCFGGVELLTELRQGGWEAVAAAQGGYRGDAREEHRSGAAPRTAPSAAPRANPMNNPPANYGKPASTQERLEIKDEDIPF